MTDFAAAARRWWASPIRDVAFALLMTAVVVLGSLGEAYPRQPIDKIMNGHPVPHAPAAAFLLVGLAGLVLAARNRWPVAVLVLSTAAVAAYSLLGFENGAVLLAPAVAVYSVATSKSPRQAIAWAGGILAVLLAVTAARNPAGPAGGGFYLIPALIAGPCFGGIAVASRRAFVASISDRAAQDAMRQIDEERLRIARELHDVVAHTMATINVQAGAAAHVVAERPEAAVQALHAIKAASKEGLRELRAILNVLRQADDADPTEPAAGLARLDALVEGTRRAGLPTTLTVRGSPAALPAAVDLAAYRIVQESLTNTIRHAGPATAAVTLEYRTGELLIEVSDTGRAQTGTGGTASANGGGGHGLAGMRERARSAGGWLDAGPAPGGGFRVRAGLPPAAGAAAEPLARPGGAAGQAPGPAAAAGDRAAADGGPRQPEAPGQVTSGPGSGT